MHNNVVRALVPAGAAVLTTTLGACATPGDEPAARKPLHDHREMK